MKVLSKKSSIKSKPSISKKNKDDTTSIKISKKDLDNLQYYRDYLTPREFLGQATEMQSLLQRAGMPTVGPTNIFDKIPNDINIVDSVIYNTCIFVILHDPNTSPVNILEFTS